MIARDGYAIVTLEEVAWSGDDRASLTESLGCTHCAVDVYRTTSGTQNRLPDAREAVCVPVDAAGAVRPLDDRQGVTSVSRRSIARVPAGAGAELSSRDRTTWIVVTAEAKPDPDGGFTVVDVGDVPFSVPETSDIPIARLTARLGCTGTKVNYRNLAPDSSVPYHTEGTQEELFVPLDGPGTVLVDGETHTVPAGGVVRVAPETPRAAVNDGENDRLWFMVGAPPTGGPDEWDPGAEILEDDTPKNG